MTDTNKCEALAETQNSALSTTRAKREFQLQPVEILLTTDRRMPGEGNDLNGLPPALIRSTRNAGREAGGKGEAV